MLLFLLSSLRKATPFEKGDSLGTESRLCTAFVFARWRLCARVNIYIIQIHLDIYDAPEPPACLLR